MASDAETDFLTCAVCKETYRDPKLLSCHHSFCQPCLRSLHALAPRDRSLTCPTCRVVTSLPPGGVSSLQSNFYLTPFLGPDLCPKHIGRRLEFLCVKDCVPLCVVCRVEDHTGHDTGDLEKARSDARARLDDLRIRADQAGEELNSWLKAREENFGSFIETVNGLKRCVRERADLLMAKVKEGREKIEEKLESILDRRRAEHDMESQLAEERQDTFRQVQNQVQELLHSDLTDQLRLLRTDRRRGAGITALLPRPLTFPESPRRDVMLFRDDSDVQDDVIERFLGVPSELTGKLVKMFRCVEDPHALVHAIAECSRGFLYVAYSSSGQTHEGWVSKFTPNGNGQGCGPQPITDREGCVSKFTPSENLQVCAPQPVTGREGLVSKFTPSGNRQDCAPQPITGREGLVSKFTPSGNLQDWNPRPIAGRVCLSAVGEDGEVRVEGEEFPARDWRSQLQPSNEGEEGKAYNVYTKPSARFLLRVLTSGRGCEARSVNVRGDGATTDTELLFHLDVTHPVALDVSRDGDLFAVVDATTIGNQVKVFRRGQSRPHATYDGRSQPPVLPYDVSFFPIGGKESLVVADWRNDSLCVLDVSEDGRLAGRVGLDCPDLTRPTALCPDSVGRLWIGCQGGQMLTLTYP